MDIVYYENLAGEGYDIIEDFKESGNNAYLLLFEKACTRGQYHVFDDDPGFVVNNDYNSFKIVSFS